MGIIGWIFAGIAVGILVGALIRIFGKKKSSKRHAVPWAASRHSWNSFTTAAPASGAARWNIRSDSGTAPV